MKVYWRGLGLAVHKLRRERNLTLIRLSDVVGLSTSFLSDIESGRAIPSYESLEKIATGLDVTIEVIVPPRDSE